jgi:hypothetical protein
VTTTPPVWCATRLRYAPDQRGAIVLDSIRIEMGLAFSSWAGKVRSRKPGPCSMFEYSFVFSAPLSDNGLEGERLTSEDLSVGFLVSMGTCGLDERTRFG